MNSLLNIEQSFAINSGQPTMKLKDPRLEALVDTAQSFTHNDLKEITMAYQCAGKIMCIFLIWIE